jgi:YD repeat-containing protein
VLWTFATLGNKEKEQQLREYMWKTELPCNPTRTLTPDSVTDYEYDYDNRLVEVSLPTNNDTVEYTYDAMGRRLKKKFTYHNGSNTDVTTYKYHYIGGQITEIEIDSIRNPGESQTVLRDEEVKIHLGANSQPISYEWVKHVGGNTTQATYYYHYDIHDNVLKITDSSENIKITYTYDTLGSILTETNPDSILNFFTFRGASQTIWDSEVGMYYSGGYYRPDTGTALQGTGAPVLTNPASGAMLNAVALATSANAQLAAHAMVSAATAGSDSGGVPGGFSPPSGPSDGFAHAGNQGPAMNTESTEPTPKLTTCNINGVAINSDYPLLLGVGNYECNCREGEWCPKCEGKKGSIMHPSKPSEKDEGDGTIQPSWPPKPGDPGYVTPLPCPPPVLTDKELDLICEKEGVPTSKDIKKQKDKEDEARQAELEALIEDWGNYVPWMEDEVDKTDWHAKSREMEAQRRALRDSIQWAVFGKDANGNLAVVGYQLLDKQPKLFYPSGDPLKPYGGPSFVHSWKNYDLYSKNFTGTEVCIQFVLDVRPGENGIIKTIQMKISEGFSENVTLKYREYTKDRAGNLGLDLPWLGDLNHALKPGDILVLTRKPKLNLVCWKKGVLHDDVWGGSSMVYNLFWE